MRFEEVIDPLGAQATIHVTSVQSPLDLRRTDWRAWTVRTDPAPSMRMVATSSSRKLCPPSARLRMLLCQARPLCPPSCSDSLLHGGLPSAGVNQPESWARSIVPARIKHKRAVLLAMSERASYRWSFLPTRHFSATQRRWPWKLSKPVQEGCRLRKRNQYFRGR